MPEDKKAGAPEAQKGADELTDAVDKLGRSAWGLGTRLFGPKVIPPPKGEQTPLSPQTELAIETAGATLGRWLHAAGVGIEAHPMNPAAAVEAARAHIDDMPEPAEGETALTAGARDLGGGLYKLAEGVLDVVAPRRAGQAATEDGTTPAPEQPAVVDPAAGAVEPPSGAVDDSG